jgi:hypothetical protein
MLSLSLDCPFSIALRCSLKFINSRNYITPHIKAVTIEIHGSINQQQSPENIFITGEQS